MSEARRRVTIHRLEQGVYRAVNERGGSLRFGSEAGDDFAPVELLLAALAGCSAVDVDRVVGRRVEPESFEVDAEADVVKDDRGNHLEQVELSFRLKLPAGSDLEAVLLAAQRALRVSREKTCTVGRTLELPTEVTARFEDLR